MSFTSKNLQSSPRKGMTFLKGATFFFLGMSAVMFLTQAFEIVPMTRNVMTLMNKIVLTSDGNPSSPQRIILDGTLGKASFSGDVVAGSGICLGGVCNTSRPAGGSSVWSTGPSNVVYYTSGNIGIGTANPGYILDVNGTGRITNGLYFGVSPLGEKSKIHEVVGALSIKGYTSGFGPTDGGDIKIDGGTPNGGNYGDVLLATDGGNVGIRNANPTYTLDVAGTGNFNQGIISSNIYFHNVYSTSYMKYIPNPAIGDVLTTTLLGKEYMRLYNKRSNPNQDSIVINNDNNDIDVVVKGTGDDTLLYIDASKNTVGIGIANPAAKLTVEGGIKPKSVTSNPCGGSNYPEGTMFYNNVNNYYCFCVSSSAAKKMHDPGVDCDFTISG